MTEIKFTPQAQGKPTASYNTVKEAIIIHIQKTYKNGQDISKSLKQEKKSWICQLDEPVMMSFEPDRSGELGQIEQAGLNIRYQEELR